MPYTVGELARLSGISARTLRLYDQMGLLCPERDPDNGYRRYGEGQVNALQQILFLREMGMELKEIHRILQAPDFDPKATLEKHYRELLLRKEQTERLLQNVRNTLSALNGGKTMKDVEKFEGFKREAVQENEKRYGKEIRAAYGEKTVEASNQKWMGMNQEQWTRMEALRKEINEGLKAAMETGDPAGEAAQEVCRLHKEWLCQSWPDGLYTRESHLALVENYLVDERFKANYDNAAGEGATAFLCKAMAVYCGK